MARRDSLLLERFPYAAIAIGRDRRALATNGLARELLGDELDELVARFADAPLPLPPTTTELSPGRTLRISGLAASATEPPILLVEDVTESLHRERVTHEFVRNAAHQLRTPLTGITAAIETLQRGAKEDPVTRDRFLAHLETHARRVNRLAHGLLLLARAQNGEVIPVDVVELRPVIESVVDQAPPRGGVELRLDAPRGIDVVATPDLLHEVLAALVENAVQHTRNGNVRIGAAEANGLVSVTVADTGPGIPPEFHGRLFEPFFRVASSGDGYGLGLTIAAQAIEAMHGRIGVSSEPGVGTTFTVTLPSARAER